MFSFVPDLPRTQNDAKATVVSQAMGGLGQLDPWNLASALPLGAFLENEPTAVRNSVVLSLLIILVEVVELSVFRGATTGLMHRSKSHPYSITSSARASSCGEISRPSAFAVLRLITSSNLVGCWTGRSAGFSPLRMRVTY